MDLKLKKCDCITFGWNHILWEPSSIMSIESYVVEKNGVLFVPVPVRISGKEETRRIRLSDLVRFIKSYDPEVIPIEKSEITDPIPEHVIGEFPVYEPLGVE